ncbi:MAG: dethiobiotin synthase [Kangiellaceae bacterium]
MKKKYFITGTDTDVGKTLVTCALIQQFQEQGLSVIATKPIAAGCELIDGQLKNADALKIIQSLNHSVPYELINPVTLKSPIAPHIAADDENKTLSVNTLQSKCSNNQVEEDYLLIEGAGGWLVPLNAEETIADYVKAEGFGVILVVGMKLGCINHSLLTIESIRAKGLNLVGWIANCVDNEMMVLDHNIQSLIERIDAPLLAIIPFIDDDGDINEKKRIKQASTYVNIAPLI